MWRVDLAVLLTIVSVVKGYDSDHYGRFEYDRYGYRRYTYCYDRLARTQDDCRDRFYDRDDSRYRDNSYYDEDRKGEYVGRGWYREYGRDVELTCEFPRGTNIVSNIVWEKVEDSKYRSDRYFSWTRSRYSSLEDWLGRRMEVRRIGDYGSRLIIKDWEERDKGEYRCVASRSYPGYRFSETVYMDVAFNPSRGRYNYDRYDNFNDHFNGDRYYDRYGGDYYPSNSYRSLLASEEETVVLDEQDEPSS